jgi:hypothetical protein
MASNGILHRPILALALVVLAIVLASLGCSEGSLGQLPEVADFTATPAQITDGQTSLLSWVVSDASSVSIDHGIGPASGARSRSSPFG